MKYVGTYNKVRDNLDYDLYYLVYCKSDCIMVGKIFGGDDNYLLAEVQPLLTSSIWNEETQNRDILIRADTGENEFSVRKDDEIFLLDKDEVLKHIVLNIL